MSTLKLRSLANMIEHLIEIQQDCLRDRDFAAFDRANEMADEAINMAYRKLELIKSYARN